MMPASNNGVGMSIGFPDVKLTPPLAVPVPYPNMALGCMSAVFSPNIFVGYMPQTSMASIKPITLGNQAGVMHPLYMMMGGQTLGNPRVLINCIPAQHLCIPTFGNLFNNPIGLVAVPSITTTRYADSGAKELTDGSMLGAEQVRLLRDAVKGSAENVSVSSPTTGVVWVTAKIVTSDLATRIFNALSKVTEAKALVVDLRGNPGGDAEAALEVAGDFLPKGATLAVFDDGEERTPIKNRVTGSAGAKLVLLVDGATASSAEVLVACLKHHGRAVIVGARTYGKTTSQSVTKDDAGAYSYGTVARYDAPDGSPIDGVGIEPDIWTSEADAAAAALEAALSFAM